MGKKRKNSGNLTPKDWEKYNETTRMLEERLAYRKAREREEDEAEARRQAGES